MSVCMYMRMCCDGSVVKASWELTLYQNRVVHSPWPDLPQGQQNSTEWSILQQADCNQKHAPSGPAVCRITTQTYVTAQKLSYKGRGSNLETILKLIENFIDGKPLSSFQVSKQNKNCRKIIKRQHYVHQLVQFISVFFWSDHLASSVLGLHWKSN